MGARPDAIVVYVWGSDTQTATAERDRLLGVLETFQKEPLGDRAERLEAAKLPCATGTCADLFLPRIPPTTQPASGVRGVSHAPHPADGSYGETRMAPLQLAFDDTAHERGGPDTFRARAEQRAWESGINPRVPWERGPTAPERARRPASPKVAPQVAPRRNVPPQVAPRPNVPPQVAPRPNVPPRVAPRPNVPPPRVTETGPLPGPGTRAAPGPGSRVPPPVPPRTMLSRPEPPVPAPAPSAPTEERRGDGVAALKQKLANLPGAPGTVDQKRPPKNGKL